MVMDYLKVGGFVCTAVTALRDTQISLGQANQIH
jgi:hypothetical protein